MKSRHPLATPDNAPNSGQCQHREIAKSISRANSQAYSASSFPSIPKIRKTCDSAIDFFLAWVFFLFARMAAAT